MNTTELQNIIIRKILDTQDKELLSYFNSILAVREKDSEKYKLSDFEKQVINESLTDYQQGNVISNDGVFSKTEKWLEE